MMQIVVLFIVSLFVVILVHEFGHFIASKRIGVAVEEFGIGFPPRLFGRMWKGTLYSVNALPIGAFVRARGENNPNIEGSLASKGPWRRLFVYVAGPVANILLAFILLAAFFALPRGVIVSDGVLVYNVQHDSAAQDAGLEPGDVIINADGRSIRTWNDLQAALTTDSPQDPVELQVLRNSTQFETSVTPVYSDTLGRHVIGITLARNMVTSIEPGSLAQEAQIARGDSLLGVNGLAAISDSELAKTLSAVSPDDQAVITMMRGDETYTVKFAGSQLESRPLGLELQWAPDTRVERQAISLGSAVLSSATYIVTMPALIAASIPLMQEDPSLALVGPIGAGQLTVEAVQTFGAANLIFIAGLISIGIALFNLFPIPPLDGGGILVSLIEAVRRGRRLSERSIRFVYAAGTAFLITLVILITTSDLLRLIEGRGFGL